LLERNRLHDVAFWFWGDEKEAEELATEKDRSRRICHGMTRKNTEKDRSRNTEKKEEEKTFLPRNDTEIHGNKTLYLI
jgi:hypothetical protein